MRKFRLRFAPYIVQALREQRHQAHKRDQVLEAARVKEQLMEVPTPNHLPYPDYPNTKF